MYECIILFKLHYSILQMLPHLSKRFKVLYYCSLRGLAEGEEVELKKV